MRTFGIAEIADMSGLSISQIEQAISRERIDVRGRGRPRQFLATDAFTFCVIGEIRRRLGVDWRIMGSTASPWPIDDPFKIDKTELLLLTPMADGAFDITTVSPDEIAMHLKSFKAFAGIVIDASAIARRIESIARKR
jgi:hypothetical protein